MSPITRILALGTLLLTACIPGLGFQVTGRDGGVPPGDGAVPGDARPGGDGGLPPECQVQVTCDACPLPWLLVGVEDLPGGDDCGGMVLRYALTGITESCACAPLTGGGQVPDIGYRVGVYPPDTVVVANSEEIVAVSGQSDRMLWRQTEDSTSNLPVDVFAIQTPTGDPRIAVAWSPGTSTVGSITVYDARDGSDPQVWYLNSGGIPLSNPSSLTQSPFTPYRFLALRNDMYASTEIDPWAMTRSDPPHVARRDDTVLRTIHALYHEGFFHTGWTGEQSGTDGVFNHWTSAPEFDQRVPLVDDCDEDHVCTFERAVVDPAVQTGMIALCLDPTGGPRRVVRVRSTATGCTDVMDATELPDGYRISSLAIAAPTFWPE